MKTNRKQIGLSLTEEEFQALLTIAKNRSSKTKVVHLIYEAIEKIYFQKPQTNGNGHSKAA